MGKPRYVSPNKGSALDETQKILGRKMRIAPIPAPDRGYYIRIDGFAPRLVLTTKAWIKHSENGNAAAIKWLAAKIRAILKKTEKEEEDDQ